MPLNKETKFFHLLDQLSFLSYTTQSAQLSIGCWKENSWIHAFHKVISTMWNEKNFVQNS